MRVSFALGLERLLSLRLEALQLQVTRFHKQRFKVPGEKSYAAIRDVGPLRAAWVTLKATNAL